MYKKWGCITLVLALILALLSGCAQPVQTQQGKLHIVATLFPQYDFARQIAGNRAQVTMLLPVGMDTHSYDPTPADILSVQNADLFVYTGEQMESWAHRIVAGVDAEQLQVVDISKGITLLQVTHNAQETDEQEQDGHDHTYDPHIWTSPKNAQMMVQTLLEAIIIKQMPNAISVSWKRWTSNFVKLYNKGNAIKYCLPADLHCYILPLNIGCSIRRLLIPAPLNQRPVHRRWLV